MNLIPLLVIERVRLWQLRIRIKLIIGSLVPASYKHFNKILLYSDNKTLSLKDIKPNPLSKQKFDLEVYPTNKAKDLSMKGRPIEKEVTNRRNFLLKSRGRKASKFYKYCWKPGHLVADCYKLNKRSERRDE